jgi:hypothetical protein
MFELEPLVLQVGGSTAKAVAAAGTAMFDVVTGGRNLLSVTVTNTGATNALTGCKIQRKLNVADDWRDFFADTDFASTTNSNLEFVSTVTPHDLAAAGTSNFSVWVQGAYAIRLVLTSTSGTTATAIGSLTRG